MKARNFGLTTATLAWMFGLLLLGTCSMTSATDEADDTNSWTASSQVKVYPSGLGDNVTIVSPLEGESPTNSSLTLLQEWCRENRQEIRKLVFSPGGLLLRGWDLEEVQQAEHLLFEAMGFDHMELFPQTFIDFNLRAQRLGVSPGLTQNKLSRDAPKASKGTMQCPHVEYGIGAYRPRVVGFFVERPPAVDGTTARVFFPEAVERLSPELYQLLAENGWWNPVARVVQPSILLHPETGLFNLQLNTFSQKLAPVTLEAYRHVRATIRPDLPEVLDVPYDGDFNYGIELVRPNGTKFELSHEYQLELFSAMFATIRLQSWEKGDMMLFDNILYGHFRMPGEQTRKLHALFAEEIDTRTLHDTATAPACVKQGATTPAPGSVETMLDQLGMGGNIYVLWTITNLLPDSVFQFAGHYLWATGGGWAAPIKEQGEDTEF